MRIFAHWAVFQGPTLLGEGLEKIFWWWIWIFQWKGCLRGNFSTVAVYVSYVVDIWRVQLNRYWQVGCGAGNTIFPLIATFPKLYVHACDFSPKAVTLVKVCQCSYVMLSSIKSNLIIIFCGCWAKILRESVFSYKLYNNNCVIPKGQSGQGGAYAVLPWLLATSYSIWEFVGICSVTV